MIERLIARLLKGITILPIIKDIKLLIEGFSVEFYRFLDYKDSILISVVPNKDMDVQTIPDYNNAYGIPSSLGGTDSEKIDRIIERSDGTGFPGKDWLHDQVRNAGYDLYVRQQEILPSFELQWGDFQFSEDVQFGLTERFVDPSTIPGILIVNQPYGGFGKIYIAQCGPGTQIIYDSMMGNGIQMGFNQMGTVRETIINQMAEDGQDWTVQMGTPNLDFTYPRAQQYDVTKSASSRFGFYFFLSPFEDRLADSSELLQIDTDQLNYLKTLVISSKLSRDYCIAQVEVV